MVHQGEILNAEVRKHREPRRFSMGFLVVYTVFGVRRPELEVEKSANSYNFALNPDWAAPYRAHRARRARQITHCAATGCKGKSRRRSLWLIKTSNKPDRKSTRLNSSHV